MAAVLGAAAPLALSVSAYAQDKQAPDLTSYSTSKRIWLSAADANLQSKGWQKVHSQAPSYVELKRKSGEMLKKGDLWAILNPRKLELQRKNLELSEIEHKRELSRIERDAIDMEIKDEKTLDDLNSQRQELKTLLKNPRLTSKKMRANVTKSIARLDRQITQVEERLKPEDIAEGIKLRKEQLQLKIKRARLDFEKAERSSFLRAPFDSKLELGVEPEEGKKRVWVDMNQHIASFSDLSAYDIKTQPNNNLVTQCPPEQLYVIYNAGPNLGPIEANFEEIDRIESGKRTTKIYVFRIAKKYNEKAKQAVGDGLMVHIYRNLTKPCYMVPKKDLLRIAPEILEKRGWNGLVAHLWPGAKVVQTAPNVLAIAPPNEK